MIAVASADSEPYLRKLGVEDFVGYERGELTDVVRRICPEGVDGLLDLVGGEQELDGLVAVVKEKGRVVSTLERIGDGRPG